MDFWTSIGLVIGVDLRFASDGGFVANGGVFAVGVVVVFDVSEEFDPSIGVTDEGAVMEYFGLGLLTLFPCARGDGFWEGVGNCPGFSPNRSTGLLAPFAPEYVGQPRNHQGEQC